MDPNQNENEKTETQNEIDNKRIEEIGKLAATVAEQDAELEGAIDGERKAETALLRAVCERVQPAISALSSRVQLSMSSSHDEDDAFANWRGYYLNCSGEQVGPCRSLGFRSDTSGTFEGVDLFLCPDSSDGSGFQFRELVYSGTWTRHVDGVNRWRATVRVMPLASVAAEWEISDLLACIETGLRAHVSGGATKRAAQARASTDKLNAIVALLGK